jgi:peptidoglycan/xylan/chitin deacetylase (PgdA/CDA1 family)
MLALILVVSLFVTPLYFIYRPPTFLIRYFQYHWPDVLWNVSTESKIVALTIDDGPSEFTKDIMHLLKDNEAAATFFIIGGQVSGREKTLQELIRNGNELANHAMHDEPSRSLSETTLVEEIHAVEEMLSAAYSAVAIPHPPKYFRPGSGFFSTKMRASLKALGYRLVLGNVYPHDPQISMPNVNARHILSMVKPGSIIICHDRRPWTVPMLKTVLPELRKRGYRIVTVTTLLRETEAKTAT